jgi:lipopolysaccharide transport system permease protein
MVERRLVKDERSIVERLGMEAPMAPSWDYVRRMWTLRWFWYSLVQNDLQTRYRHSFLGIGWSLARPLGLTAIFCLVFGRLLDIPLAEYAPFVLVGLTLWQFVAENINLGCKTFTTSAAYIRQQRVPLAIFPLRTCLGAAFHMGVALTLGLAVTWYFKGFGNLAVLPVVVPSMLLFFLMVWSLAIVCGLVQTHFRDTCYTLELLLQFVFYLTPIIYRPSTLAVGSRLSWVVDLNPLWSVLELMRRPILYGQLPSTYNVLVSVGFVGLLATLAIVLLRRCEPRLVFWI